MTRNVLLLMGPTASGKTDIAIELCKRFPCEIISVDSAMVYRGMDIGTAKPDRDTLRRVPHRLVDIRDPEEGYSAGEFVRDAQSAIDSILARQRIPLLVGGTMLYFRALTEGIAEMPPANVAIRKEIDDIADHAGWPTVHEHLAAVDPAAAARINPNDSQRIQRALEVYLSSGKALSEWQQQARPPVGDRDFLKIGLQLEPRARLHERIEARLNHMLENGFLEELRALYARPGLTRRCSSMRSVGYRQFWDYLDGNCSLDEARDKALFATRQLAKRQLTWLRSESGLFFANSLEAGVVDTISQRVGEGIR